MKKILVALALVAALIRVHAVPAYPYPVAVTQPDGSMLTLLGHGDEFYNYITTQDGYSLVQNEAGYYVYAMERNGAMTASNMVAHDPDNRSIQERQFLQGVSKGIIDKRQAAEARTTKKLTHGSPQKISNDYKNFKGLIILINYTDVHFSRSDAQDFYMHMFNDVGYHGYTNEDGSANPDGVFTGSVRDYYYDNSNGIFAPQFGVAGPYEVNYKSTDGRNNSRKIFEAAVQAAIDDGVDFSQYDCDNNGEVDMVYFLVAGHGSNVTGNNSKLLWPHMSSLQQYTGDKWVTLYASSTVLCGLEGTTVIDGVGTVCHEFTHVLGFPDLYDTDYEANGLSHHPGDWDIMAGGSYLNNSRTPAGYSAFEKYALGFATPTLINDEKDLVLPPLGDTHKSFMLRTPKSKEYFLFENRQRQSKWDAYLPGHGMLVVRVDSSGTWEGNGINSNPAHNYYELLRAGGSRWGAMPSDPFPGTSNVFYLSNNTTANLRTWDGTDNEYVVYNIQEKNNNIYFSTLKEYHIQAEMEDFESMPVTAASGATEIEGNFSTWDFTKCNVVTAADSLCNGVHAVAMTNPSILKMNESLYNIIYMVTAEINNPTSSMAGFTLSFSTDEGETWETAKPSTTMVLAQSAKTFSWIVDAPAGARIRLSQTAGSSSDKVYVDDIIIYHHGEYVLQFGDVNLDGRVNVSDVTELINMILGIVEVEEMMADVNFDGRVNVSDVTALINIILGIK